MADHSKPTTAQSDADYSAAIRDRFTDLARFLDPATTSPTNLSAETIRWNSSTKRFEIYTGSPLAWEALADAYSININGTVGADTPATGAFTTVTTTGYLGVNKETPAAAIDVEGSDVAGSRISVLRTGSSDAAAQLFSQGNAGGVAVTGAYPLLFYTDTTLRATIDGSGNILFGITSPLVLASDSQEGACWTESTKVLAASRDAGAPFALRRRTSDGAIASFFRGTSTVGTISVTTTATAYNTSSDYRLKTGIVDFEDGESGAFIDALRPRKGTWLANGEPFVGFIAHETAEVSPSSVTGEKDGPEMQSMQASSPEIMANIVAELQALRARVAALEAAE